MTDSPLQTLTRIHDRLHAGADLVPLIQEMLPGTREEAVSWGRRLSGWDEYRDRFPGQVVALARLVSRRAMIEYGLVLAEDGRVTDRTPAHGTRGQLPEPERVFTIRDGQVLVEYTRGDFTNRDHFQFKSPHDPVRPMPLSATGWWSHFTNRDTVEACGGPEAYATLYAEAKVQGRDEPFVVGIEGGRCSAKPPRKKPVVWAPQLDRPVKDAPPAPAPERETPSGDDPPPGRLF